MIIMVMMSMMITMVINTITMIVLLFYFTVNSALLMTIMTITHDSCHHDLETDNHQPC